VYTLGQAAKATGRSKSALSRDVKAGRVSATRNADGSLQIDPAELHRVFPPVSRGNGTDNVAWDASQPVAARPDNGVLLARENALLRDQLADRDRTLVDLRESIRDLRQRLDAEAEERRRVQERLAGLLTRRQAASVPEVPLPRPPWWRRWLG
jgi:hypothetical protein